MASLVAHRSASSNQGTQRCQVREHMMQRYSFKLHMHHAKPTRLPAKLCLLLPQVKPSKRTADLAKKPLSVFASRNDVRASPWPRPTEPLPLCVGQPPTNLMRYSRLSPLQSHLQRFKHQIPTTDVPPPGSYNVTPSWNTSSFARRRGVRVP